MAERIPAALVEGSSDRRAIKRHGAGGSQATTTDAVAVEEPLELRLEFGPLAARQEASVSITMRTPGADRELAAGFLFGEGMITGPADVSRIEPCGPAVPGSTLHNVIRVELEPHVEVDPERLLRHFYTTSSCGVCGKASLDALHQQPRIERSDAGFSVSRELLQALPSQLAHGQAIFAQTGGLHGAACFDALGEMSGIHEDVGRHNAVDKLIGDFVMSDTVPLTARGLLLSGRASFELLQKAMMAGLPLVAAIGAPSSLAIDLAEEFGMTLIGFLRADGFNVYSHPERVVG